jgi:hypothetical protein
VLDRLRAAWRRGVEGEASTSGYQETTVSVAEFGADAPPLEAGGSIRVRDGDHWAAGSRAGMSPACRRHVASMSPACRQYVASISKRLVV